MTKKDYEAIASSVRAEVVLTSELEEEDGFPLAYRDQRKYALLNLTCRLADRLNEDNPRFDRERFMVACGF